MNIFSWLFLGHLVGDWLLQNDWMAANKQRRLFTVAGMAHFTVYTASIAIALYFALAQTNQSLSFQSHALFLSAIFVSHWLIDANALARKWASFSNQSDLPLVNIMVDQTFHLIVIAALITWTL